MYKALGPRRPRRGMVQYDNDISRATNSCLGRYAPQSGAIFLSLSDKAPGPRRHFCKKKVFVLTPYGSKHQNSCMKNGRMNLRV